MRAPILLSVVSGLTLLSACDDQSAAEDCRYYVQQDLDNGEFDAAISKLSSTSCQAGYPDNEYLLDLGSAYLGSSGYTLTSILSSVLTEEGSSDAFAEFISDISEDKNSESYTNLEMAETTFESFLGSDCADITDKTSTETSICLVQGAIGLTKAALAVDYLTDDIEQWVDGTDDTISFSGCALEYTVDGGGISPYTCVSNGSLDVIVESVTFDNGNTYNHLQVTDSVDSEYYLQSTDSGGLVFSSSYCSTDFTVCSDVNESSCYVCPSEDGNEESVNDFILTALNDGLDNIETIIEDVVDVEDNSEIQEAIDDFKAEIGTCDTSADECYTMDDIINYLTN